MKCELKNRTETIEKYVRGKLSKNEREAFDEHCFNCELCFRELRLREEAVSLIKEEGQILFADYLEKRKASGHSHTGSLFEHLSRYLHESRHRWIYAGAGMAIVILCLIIFRLREISPDNTVQFQTLPYLEEMLSDVSRSETITVLSPAIGQQYEDGIEFQWEGTGSETIYIKILNNQGSELYSLQTAESRFQFAQKLNPGLYYWKLESEDDLLFLGKFLVK